MKAITPATRDLRVTPAAEQARTTDNPAFRPTVFVCRPMKQRERERSWDEASVTELRPDGTRVVVSRKFQQAHEILLACLTSVEEFPEGAPEAYPATGTLEQKEAYLARLDEFTILEVANEVRERSFAGELAGNS